MTPPLREVWVPQKLDDGREVAADGTIYRRRKNGNLVKVGKVARRLSREKVRVAWRAKREVQAKEWLEGADRQHQRRLRRADQAKGERERAGRRQARRFAATVLGLVMLLVGLLGCTPAPPPGLSVARAPVAVEPIALWRTWFAQTADCLGLSRHPDEVRWHLADRIRGSRGVGIQGLHRRGEIYLLRDPEPPLRWVIKHEATHYLLWSHGLDADGAHEGPWWDACTGPGANPGAAVAARG